MRRFLGGIALLAMPSLAMAAAWLDLSSHPSGVDVWGNERYLGRTPLSVEIAPGKLLLRLVEASDSLLWRPVAVDTLLHAEEAETLRLELRLGRSFSIGSRPIGIPVMRGAKRLGETPLDLRLNPEDLGGLRLQTQHGAVPVPSESLLADGQWMWRGDPSMTASASRPGRSLLRRLGRYASPLVACGLAVGATAAERAADRSYERYLSTADPSSISKYYDEARSRDALSTALWVGAEVSLATMILAWILPEDEGAVRSSGLSRGWEGGMRDARREEGTPAEGDDPLLGTVPPPRDRAR